MSLHVLLVDSHTVFCEAVRSLLEKQSDLVIVGEAADGQSALAMARELKPDVIISEIALPRLNGVDLIVRLREIESRARVIVLTAREGRSDVEQALRAGAAAYVCKTDTAKELEHALDAIRERRSYVSPSIAQHVVDAMGGRAGAGSARTTELTSREREVLQLVAEGLTSKEVASTLGLSTRTIESHRARVMNKLGVHKVSGLVRIAMREGLLCH